jgi:hypothetical protein
LLSPYVLWLYSLQVMADAFIKEMEAFDDEMEAKYVEAEAAGNCLRFVGVVDVPGKKCAVELRQYPKTHPFAGTQCAYAAPLDSAYCLLLPTTADYCLLLLTAHCALLTAHCSLPTAHCSLLTAYCFSLPTAHHLLGTPTTSWPSTPRATRRSPWSCR